MNWRILTGDVRERLQDLDASSVQTCVTSPPYWGLRDYGTAEWEGGDSGCDHVEMPTGMSDKNTLGPYGYLPPTNAANIGRARQFREVCGKCGARRIDSQIGLEPTPDAYVQQMVAVFREVRRVLKDDGTVWLNLGDSYANTGRADTSTVGGFTGDRIRRGVKGTMDSRPRAIPNGLKSKDLCGIPWRVAFALQADGWYLRSDIIWSKPNPMPESVTDRPTKAHEYIFLLSKLASYYYDREAIAEAFARRAIFNENSRGLSTMSGAGGNRNDAGRESVPIDANGRNKRSVWHVATQPYPEAHFATFPEALIEPCVLAGSRLGDTVLDPFCGSGTTGAVAIRHQRNFVGVELNPAYVQLARARIGGEAPLFATEHTA